jgi:hypothetical protein
MSETAYNNERTKRGDTFNQDAPAVGIVYDTGENLTEQNRQIAENTRAQLENKYDDAI